MTATDQLRRQLVELPAAEAMALLGSVQYGRVVFTARALPAVRPVNHLVDRGDIVIRTNLGTAVSAAVDGTGTGTGTVVAYQADHVDPVRRLGWSVVVTGYARVVTDPAEVERFETALVPWIDGPMDTVIRIHPEIVTGFRLTTQGPTTARPYRSARSA